MNPTQFCREVEMVKSGDGFRRDIDIDIRNGCASDASPLTTTLATNPGFVMLETNFPGIVWNATIVTPLLFVFQVPGDYDQSKDELRIRLLLQGGGATDVEAITVNVYKKTAAAALSADLGPFTAKAQNAFEGPSATNYAVSNAAAYAIVDVTGKSVKAGDVLAIKITPGAHGTDTLRLYEAVARYRSDLALFNEAARS